MLLTACGSSAESTDDVAGPVIEGGQAGPAPSAPSTHPLSSDIRGAWQAGCAMHNADGSVYVTTDVRFEAERFTTEITFYAENTCTVLATPASDVPAQRVTVSGQARERGATTSTSLGEARHLDLALESVLLDGVPMDSQHYSQAWAPDVYLISEGALYVGKVAAPSSDASAAARPTALDLDFRLTRG